jgi:predicted O-methyltransferase YrrM
LTVARAALGLLVALACPATGAKSAQGRKWYEESSEENAKSLALYFDREARRYFVYTEGNIASSEKALSMYFHTARGPTVKNICEVGFNAGHSAAVFLNANPEADMYSFDIGQFPYTRGNAALMKDLFPDRFEYISGPSQETAVQFAQERPKTKCDLISIDGDHTHEGTFQDLVNFRHLASCRNWVLMDDAGWNSTNSAWQRAKDEGIITQVECFADMNPHPDFQFMDFPMNRSWCLGFFNVGDLDDQCPVWFETNPNTDKTYVRPIEI